MPGEGGEMDAAGREEREREELEFLEAQVHVPCRARLWIGGCWWVYCS
jgi:hypothetical protein